MPQALFAMSLAATNTRQSFCLMSGSLNIGLVTIILYYISMKIQQSKYIFILLIQPIHSTATTFYKMYCCMLFLCGLYIHQSHMFALRL